MAASADITLWHDSLHGYFDEKLYYCFITFKTLQENVLGEIPRLLQDRLQVKGLCKYLIYGEADVLLRLWLTFKQEERLIEFLTTLPELQRFFLFQVQKISLHWARGDSQNISDDGIRNILNQLGGPSVIRRVQNGDVDDGVISRLKDSRLLLLQGRTYDPEKEIKAFIGMTRPNIAGDKAAEESLQNHLRALLTGERLYDARPSLYFGRGGLWGLAKVIVPKERYSDIERLVMSINSEVSTYAVRTTTYLVCDPDPVEKDHVNDESINQRVVGSQNVSEWLPELVNAEVLTDKQKLDISSHLIRQNFFAGLASEDRELLRDFLRLIATGENKLAVGHLLVWFTELESDLDTGLPRWLQRVGKDPNQVKRELLKGKDEPISLGVGLGIFADALESFGQTEDRKLAQSIRSTKNRLANIRNGLAHGAYRNDIGNRWEEICETLIAAMPVIRDLRKVAGI